MSRSEAIETISKQLGKEDIVFSTTGKISRELISKKDIYKDLNIFLMLVLWVMFLYSFWSCIKKSKYCLY